MLNELCRLCGDKSNSTVDIFSESGSQEKLELKIKEVVRLTILPEDPLPSIVCTLCVKRLENASHFIDRCHQTQKYLNRLYHDSISLDNIIIAPSDESNNTDNITKNNENTGNNSTPSTSISFDNLKSKNNNSSYTSTKDHLSNRISKENTSYADAFQNYIAEQSNISSIKAQNNSSLLIEPTPSIRGAKSAADKNLNTRTKTISKNDSNDADFKILRIKPETISPPNDRSRLKRKCKVQVAPMNDLNDSSDDDNREPDDHSDDSFDLENIDEEEYESSCEITKTSSPKSKPLPTSNKKNSPTKDVSKNSTVDQSVAPGGSKQTTKKIDSTLSDFKIKKRYQCDTCRKTFSQELTYQEHLNVHTGNRPFSCKLCTASFRRRQELNQHLRTVHSEKQFKCPSCDHVAKHKGKLTEHIKSVHDKPFACDKCDYRTGEKGKILQHIANKHTADLSFVCEICGNGFKTKISLQVHLRNIHFPEPKVCQTCGTVCPSLARYSSHIFRCGKEKKRYPCEKCGKTYVNKEILKDHMNKHLNVKPYKCDVCGKEFFQRNRLDTHKYVHRGANYQCEICNQSFNRKDNMKNHMKRHFYKSMRYDNMIVTAV